jgi:hypothetical protein
MSSNNTSPARSLPALPALPTLPCYPCPYDASCCAFGSTVTDEEAAAIEANHGPGLVYRTRSGEMRTRVRNGRCALYRDGACTIHDRSYYPAVCRGFPWTDAETGGRYEYDVTICGAFEAQPELIALQRAIPTIESPCPPPASPASAPSR